MSEPRGAVRCFCIGLEGPTELRERGALVRVEIGPSPEDIESRSVARTLAISVVLMIDTGSRWTFVEDARIQKLGLAAERYEKVYGIFPDPQDCPVYRLAVTVPLVEQNTRATHRLVLPLEIIGLPTPKHPQYSMGLLGRDFLEGVVLSYNGKQGTCLMELWPGRLEAPELRLHD